VYLVGAWVAISECDVKQTLRSKSVNLVPNKEDTHHFHRVRCFVLLSSPRSRGATECQIIEQNTVIIIERNRNGGYREDFARSRTVCSYTVQIPHEHSAREQYSKTKSIFFKVEELFPSCFSEQFFASPDRAR